MNRQPLKPDEQEHADFVRRAEKKAKRQWLFGVLFWYAVTISTFCVSEYFRDTWLIYPSVFILIAFMLIGPGMIGMMTPFCLVRPDSPLRPLLPLLAYGICYVSMWLFGLFCGRMHLFR